jgi:peptidyl-prolyl cis-trans isomerase SurA
MKPPKPVLLSLSLLLALQPGAFAELLERVIVRVNGDIVTQSEFESRQVAAVQAARIGASEVERYLRENNARILQEAVDELLLVQRAAELGYKVPATYLDEVVEGIKKENNIANDDDLRAQLRREGMSIADLRRNIERSVLRRQVLQRELESKTLVSEAEARADYDAHLADYTREPSVHLEEIFLKGEDAATKARALALVERARAGESFTDLAKAQSQGATAASGGDLGTLARGDISPELAALAFSLEAGGISEPVPQGGGYRVLKLVEKKDGSVVPFAEAREEINRRLSQTRIATVYEEYLVGLRKGALIDLKVREVPLQIDLPTGPGLEAPSLGQAPPGAAAAAPPPIAPPTSPAADVEEFTTSPQARPERIVPPAAPGVPTPAPTPTPQP